MNKFEEIDQVPEHTPPKPKTEKHDDASLKQGFGHEPYQKTSAELARIDEIHRQLWEEHTEQILSAEQPTTKNPTEIEVINGEPYHVEYVPKEDIYPAYGYGGGNSALVRQDLPPRVKKFVKAHELYHCRDKATWGGWVGREIRANSMCGLKDPIGLIATAWKTLTDVDRIKFYMKRMKEGH